MIIKIELKTNMANDSIGRIPTLEKIQTALDKYSEGFKGVVVLHNSLYEYRYDTKNNLYSGVDSNQIIGNIRYTEVDNDKLYLFIEANDSFNVNNRFICFFRSNMQSAPGNRSAVFDDLNIFVVDIVTIGDNETVDDSRLSEVTIVKK